SRVSKERMGEAEGGASGTGRQTFDDAQADELVEIIDQSVMIYLQHTREHLGVECSPDHGRRLGQCLERAESVKPGRQNRVQWTRFKKEVRSICAGLSGAEPCQLRCEQGYALGAQGDLLARLPRN